uniref:TIR domain-containing protein n=1 Tax=Fundulus heteroclitus TaxID=8078 RepID=A0A3Q2P911_FUNHE
DELRVNLNMFAKGSWSLYFIWRFLCLLLFINPSNAYSLKNCTILYQGHPSADVSLDCADRKLVAIPHDIPKDAVSVNLHKNLLQRINKEDLSEMPNLKDLTLTHNEISHVDDGSFSDLTLLKILSIGYNKLTNLTNKVFQGLSNLTMLDLRENKIRFIHKSAFRFLFSLEHLDLSGNELQKITDIIPILQLQQIRKLSVHCSLFSFFETTVQPPKMSSSLTELVVSDCNLEKFSILTDIFPYLQKLVILPSGGHTDIKYDIPDKTLVHNITQLYLTDSTLSFEGIQELLTSLCSLRHLQLRLLKEWIDKALFSTICKIPTLRRLDLLENCLDNFPTELSACSQLTKLDLSKNKLTQLVRGSIQPMKQLQSLNVSQNLLSRVPEDVRSLSYLNILDLSANCIFNLTCEDFMNTTHLTELYLSTNHIITLNECVVQNLTDLRRLDLSNNLLLTFGDTFKIALENLEVLDMTDTSINALRMRDFQSLRSLKQLEIGAYVSTGKPKTFHKMNNLEENLTVKFTIKKSLKTPNLKVYKYPNIPFKSMKKLTASCVGDCTGFPINVPTDMLRGMEHLETFAAVNICAFPPDVNMFEFNTQLKSLLFQETDLSNLNPAVFRPIQKLQTLDLSKSKLRSWDFLLRANLSALRYLNLSHNDLAVINEAVLPSLPSLTYLDLSNNSFTCECSNAGFIRWAKNNKQTQVVNAHQYKCSFPVEKQGSFLLDFNIQSCWDKDNFFYFMSSTCLVILTLLTSFIYHFLGWQLVYTFHLFLAHFYDSKKRIKGVPHQFDAFVSYNVHDEEWVYREMLPVLMGEQGWRLCLHHRDFQPGKLCRLLFQTFGNYLKFSPFQLNFCSFRLFDEQKDVLILLFLEEIPARHLSPYYRMRKLVKKRTYLSWPQAAQHPGVFWQNVQRALQTGDVLTENTDLLTGPGG